MHDCRADIPSVSGLTDLQSRKATVVVRRLLTVEAVRRFRSQLTCTVDDIYTSATFCNFLKIQ